MDDKEMIKEIEAIIKSNLAEGSFANTFARKVAIQIVEHYQPKLPKDSVVLTRVEYERLSSSHGIIFCDNKNCSDNLLCRCSEISECPKNIPEYNEKLSTNKHKLELFQKLCKERERANGWEDRYKLLEEELKQSRKETAEFWYDKIDTALLAMWKGDCITTEQYNAWVVAFNGFAKQLGIEIKD